MKNKEILDLSYSEICNKESELRTELRMLRLKRKIGQLEKTHMFSNIRKNIARLLTEKSKKK